MLLFSAQVNMAVFGVFLTLEATEIILAIGLLLQQPRHRPARRLRGSPHGAVAWYTSAAGVSNGLAGRIRLPVGKPLLA